jgi:pimeloyl-ACP methyl ester carboxylesterase
VLAILDALHVPKVITTLQSHISFPTNLSDPLVARVQAFLVGKDFGAAPAYEFALRHPGRTRGVVSLGIPFSPGPVSFDTMPEGFYIRCWRVR